jgi:hypothetical protein
MSNDHTNRPLVQEEKRETRKRGKRADDDNAGTEYEVNIKISFSIVSEQF